MGPGITNIHATVFYFYIGLKDLNSGPCACVTNTFTTQPIFPALKLSVLNHISLFVLALQQEKIHLVFIEHLTRNLKTYLFSMTKINLIVCSGPKGDRRENIR